MLSAEDAIALGASGPLLRAQRRGLRHAQGVPVLELRRIRFQRADRRPAAIAYARYQVRVAEIRESMKIVKQAMEKIPSEGPFPRRSARHHSAFARGDEDLDRRPHLPLQDFHRGFCAAAGRGVSGDRIAARRAGRFHGQRRLAQAIPRAFPHAVFREFANACASFAKAA